MTEHTPSTRAGLRNDIAAALEAADNRLDVFAAGDLADAVLPVLYREWPWLRAEAEELDQGRAALVHNDWSGTRWLHIAFTNPDGTTANTSALALADHLAAEFPGVGMRITSNATEAEPRPDFTSPLTGTAPGPEPVRREERGLAGRTPGFTWSGQVVPRFTAHPVTPEMERAATARARQAAADSERSNEWLAATGGVIGTPSCSPNNPETEPNNPAAPTPPSIHTRIARAIHRYDNHHGLSGNDLPGNHHRGEADAVLTELKRELAALATYENAITWHTDCLSCARVLDSCIRETERAEKAEGALREVLDRLLPVHASGNVIGYEPPLPIEGATIDRWRAVLEEQRPEPGVHVYLSTGCWHGDHDYCKSMTGLAGAKRPAECKKCAAKCICRCHRA
jgi:hypothetical protein